MKLRKICSEQEVKTKGNFPCLLSKKAQEEIMGFGIILILVAVILIVFLGIAKNNRTNENSDDFEVTSFMNSFLQVSTYCEDNGDFLSVKDLAFECLRDSKCDNDLNSCEVLQESVETIMASSWDVGENYSNKGYELQLVSGDEILVNLSEGQKTNSYRGSFQDYSKSRDVMKIYLKIYD